MEIEQAQQIITESKSLGVYDGPMPDNDKELFAEANRICEQAEAAWAAGVRGDAVKTILIISGFSPQPEQEMNGSVVTAIKNVVEKERETEFDPELAYEQGRVGVDHVSPSLPAPPEIGATPDIPVDLTELSDEGIRKHLSIFNAAASYAGWLLSIEENLEEAAKSVADHKYDSILDELQKIEPKTNVTVLKSSANSEDAVRQWRVRELKHKTNARTLKRQLESYERTCKILSREWTIRSNDSYN